MNNNFKLYNNRFSISDRKAFIAQSLKELRKAHKLSQAEVSQAIGIKQQTYNAYELGRNEPPAELLVRISLFYNLSLDYILQKDRMNKDTLDISEQSELLKKLLNEKNTELNNADEETIEQIKHFKESLTQIMDTISKLPPKES